MFLMTLVARASAGDHKHLPPPIYNGACECVYACGPAPPPFPPRTTPPPSPSPPPPVAETAPDAAPPADVAPPADEIPPAEEPPAADEDIGVRNVMLGDHHKGDDGDERHDE